MSLLREMRGGSEKHGVPPLKDVLRRTVRIA